MQNWAVPCLPVALPRFGNKATFASGSIPLLRVDAARDLTLSPCCAEFVEACSDALPCCTGAEATAALK